MIKYHQWGIGVEYGTDHALTNNWNPNGNYDNEYSNVYFNINAEGYGYPSFSFTKEQHKAFYEEVKNCLEPLGWKTKDNGDWNCCYIVKGKSTLYLHPQQFSGEVLKNEIKTIAKALDGRKTFYLRWVDLRDTVYDISDNEYAEYLETKEKEVYSKVFNNAHTTRTTKFYNVFDIARHISDSIRLRRIGLNDGRNYGSGQTIEYVLKVIDKMIEDGYIIATEINQNKYIRSANKTEQKKRKLATI